jgi:LacI family transcriptional regulator
MSVSIIAQRAGVSPATVSRVLNDNPRVNPATAQLVRNIVREGNFDPIALRRRGPRLRRELPTNRLTFGVISLGQPHESWFRQPIFATVAAALSRSANGRSARVIFDDYMDPTQPCSAVRDGSIGGAFAFVPSQSDPELLASLSRAIPVVRVMGEVIHGTDLDHVRPDDVAIGHLAFHHLRSQGCRHLAYVTTRPEYEAFNLRGVGFSLAAARAGFRSPEILAVGSRNVTAIGGTSDKFFPSLDRLAEYIATCPNRPDAIFISQDVETIGLYPLLERRGLTPGKQFQVLSCNNEISTLSLLSPRPPSIDIGADEMARYAVERMLARIARPNDPTARILVTPRLVLPSMPDDRTG